MSAQTFCGKGPHALLWAGFCTARGKIKINGIPYCTLHDMIYLLTAIELPPGGSSTVHIYTKTIHRTTQNTQYVEQHKNFGTVRAVTRLCELYPGICLTFEEKARKNLIQGGRTIRIRGHIIFKFV